MIVASINIVDTRHINLQVQITHKSLVMILFIRLVAVPGLELHKRKNKLRIATFRLPAAVHTMLEMVFEDLNGLHRTFNYTKSNGGAVDKSENG